MVKVNIQQVLYGGVGQSADIVSSNVLSWDNSQLCSLLAINRAVFLENFAIDPPYMHTTHYGLVCMLNIAVSGADWFSHTSADILVVGGTLLCLYI
jgi:hypothetical protein